MEGEEAKTEGEEYPHVLVTKALSSRNLTQEEEQLLEDQKVCEEHEHEAIESEKLWNTLKVLAALILALTLLITNFNIVKYDDK